MKKSILLGIIVLVIVTGCTVNYNFTGGSIEPNVKTISIQPFLNQSGLGPPTMSIQFTEKLKTFYQGNTKLSLVKDNGDWQLEGMISKYFLEPVAPQASGAQAGTKITITVNVSFTDVKNEKSFKKDFSYFTIINQATTSMTQIENDGTTIPAIMDQLVLNIFSETTSNW
jgi:hypothetical protein